MADKQQPAVWRTAVVSTAPIVADTDGDGLESLRCLFTKYLKKAQYLQRLSFKTVPLNTGLVAAITFYLTAAESTRLLLGDEAENAATI